MEITSNIPNLQVNKNALKTNFTEKITKDEAVEIRAEVSQRAKDIMFKSTSIQTDLASEQNLITQNYEDFQSFLKDIGYEGKPISELSREEGAELISEDGLFGVKQTSERIADFVINGAGGDEDRLRAGREGILEGFKMAEDMWGGELPEISQITMQKATEMVDKAMHDLGFSIIKESV